ncbi:MAG: HlyD family secretion protein [Candidatus Paceibacteria bacterium]
MAQEISVQSGRATATKTREALEIQRIENESLIANSIQDVYFALLEIEKFIGSGIEGLSEMSFEEILALAEETSEVGFTGGNREQELQEYRDNILISEEELKRAEDTLDWSTQLAEKGFVERMELEADQLAFTRKGIMLEQAQRARFLLERYEHPKQWAQLQGNHEEAKRQLRKARKQEIAKLADFEAAKQAAMVMLELEEEKLARILSQIDKGNIYAPVSGMVVYGRTEGSRYGGGEPVQEGGEIRERQEILSIPGAGGMVAEASIHESALEQVVEGLAVTLRVDALPGRIFHGVVGKVAVLPDKNSFWANPNLRLYNTEIIVDESSPDMRPGMSCSIEIHVDEAPDVLFVPVQAVHHSSGVPIAWVSSSTGVESREVEIGRNNEKWLEILGGLEEGEIVLLSPPIGFQAEDKPSGEESPEGAGEGHPGTKPKRGQEGENGEGGGRPGGKRERGQETASKP